jgi:hypothetical protein
LDIGASANASALIFIKVRAFIERVHYINRLGVVERVLKENMADFVSFNHIAASVGTASVAPIK